MSARRNRQVMMAALLVLAWAAVSVAETVRVTVRPDQAYIFVDGKPIGHEGSQKVHLSPGTHQIGVYNYGYTPQVRDVTINTGENPALEFALDKIPEQVGGPFGRIQIEGAAHAAVLLNGKTPGYFVGHGDEFNNEIGWSQKLVVPPGTYQVTVVDKEKELWSGPVTVEANQRVIVDVTRGGKLTTKPWPGWDQAKQLPRFTASTATALVSVAPVTGNIVADRGQINCGETSQVSWTAKEAVDHKVVAGPQVLKEGQAAGNETVRPLQTTQYQLQAAGPGGIINPATTVNVNTQVASTMEATPNEIRYRRIGDKVITQETSKLNWTSTNAHTATLEPVGAVEVSGSQAVKAEPKQTENGPVNEMQSYTLTAKNECGGVDTRTAQVRVTGSIEPIPEVPLASVFFPTGYPEKRRPQVGLVRSQQEVLAETAAGFKKYLEYDPEAKFRLVGNTDVRDSARRNQQLSQRRAELVKQFLVAQGIPAERIETVGLGKKQQLNAKAVRMLESENPKKARKPHGGFSELVWAYNRRVDVVMQPTGKPEMASTQYYPGNVSDAVMMWDGTWQGRQVVEKASEFTTEQAAGAVQ